jgi:hypothetical protein
LQSFSTVPSSDRYSQIQDHHPILINIHIPEPKRFVYLYPEPVKEPAGAEYAQPAVSSVTTRVENVQRGIKLGF